MFLENEILYGIPFPMSEEALKDDFVLPIGKAKIVHEGTDVTIVAYSRGVQLAIDAHEQLKKEGINAEVEDSLF